MNHIDKDLSGDGRKKVYPNPEIPHEGTGMPVRLSAARHVVRGFRDRGVSIHSRVGGMMWVIQEWCHLNGIGCHVVFDGFGGSIRMMK